MLFSFRQNVVFTNETRVRISNDEIVRVFQRNGARFQNKQKKMNTDTRSAMCWGAIQCLNCFVLSSFGKLLLYEMSDFMHENTKATLKSRSSAHRVWIQTLLEKQQFRGPKHPKLSDKIRKKLVTDVLKDPKTSLDSDSLEWLKTLFLIWYNFQR